MKIRTILYTGFTILALGLIWVLIDVTTTGTLDNSAADNIIYCIMMPIIYLMYSYNDKLHNIHAYASEYTDDLGLASFERIYAASATDAEYEIYHKYRSSGGAKAIDIISIDQEPKYSNHDIERMNE